MNLRNVRFDNGIDKFGKLVLRSSNHRDNRPNRITLFVDFNKTVNFTRIAATRNQFLQCFRFKVFKVFTNATSNGVFFRYN